MLDQQQDVTTDTIILTTFRDVTGKPHRLATTLPQLADRIRQTVAPSKAALPLLKMAVFGGQRSAGGSLRNNANVRFVTGIEVEHDAGIVSFQNALDVMDAADVRCVLYTTPSHRPGAERWRILAPLSRQHEPAYREKAVARLNGLFNGYLAPESFTLSQAYYYGQVEGSSFECHGLGGRFLDLCDEYYAGSIDKEGHSIIGGQIGGKGMGAPQHEGDRSYPSARKENDPGPVDVGKVRAALDVVSPDCSYEVWLKVAGALHHALGEAGFTLFDQWSAGAPRLYREKESAAHWRGARTLRDITIGSLYWLASEADPSWSARYEMIKTYDDPLGSSSLAQTVNDNVVAFKGPTREPRAAAGEPPLYWLDMQPWTGTPKPVRSWAILDRTPLGEAGLFSGEGGTGKSIIELMKDVAHCCAKSWLGSMPEPGGAFYLGAEDSVDELHIRLHDIAAHYQVTFQEMIDGGLKILPFLGKDAVLCAAVGKGGRIEPTPLYGQILEAAGDLKPKNISIDTLSHVFAGNEIDRIQVTAFKMYMQHLAAVAQGSVTILSHPSLAGMASGTGISGSTAWHNAFRFRHYLTSIKAPEEVSTNDEASNSSASLREIQFLKNQYGALGTSIKLRYEAGVFVPVDTLTGPGKLIARARAQEVFLALLARFKQQGRNVSDKHRSPTHAPAAFAGEPEAVKARVTKADFGVAMRELFAAGKIRVERYGRSDRDFSRIVVADDAAVREN
jgi:RecA-family ATPase